MSDEAQQLRNSLKYRANKQTFMNAILFLGLVAAVVALIISNSTIGQELGTNRAAIEEVQASLNVTCDAVEQDPTIILPVSVREDCKLAQENKIPDKIIDPDDPDPNDPEQQEGEVQDPELQELEQQDAETQDADPNDPDPTDDPDANDDADNDDPEQQDEEIQESEIQDDEIQDPEEQNAPVCPPGYTQLPFHYFGPDGLDNTGDEEDWLLCKKDQVS